MHIYIYTKENFFLLWELTVAKPSRWYLSQLAKYFLIIRNKCCLPRLFGFVIFTNSSSSGLLFLRRVPEPQHSYSKYFPRLCRSISGFCWCLYLSRTPLPLISLWFHTFFRFTLGSCFPYSLLIPYSCGTSLELHLQSHLSLMLNREI